MPLAGGPGTAGISGGSGGGASSNARGAYLFSTNDSATYAILQANATAQTHLNHHIVQSDPALAAIVGPGDQFSSGTSIAEVTTLASTPGSWAVVYYDIEHWSQTPSQEQANPVLSIEQAATAVHATGSGFGITPDGQFLGLVGNCTANLQGGIIPQIDWSQVDAVDLQVQALADDSKCGVGNVSNFASFVKQAVAVLRAANPRMLISAQVSLRDSSPITAVKAIQSIEGVVDAVSIGYPDTDCPNCTPSNLSLLLQSL